jgi:hypothetical protein
MRTGQLVAALVFGLASPTMAAPPAPAPVSVMVVGVFHMANPGHDLHNLKVDDVLSPRRQAEIAAATNALARFRPTKVAAEWDADTVAERWPKYLGGTLPPSRNEVVQLGFRLAKTAHAAVFGIDVDGDFPYQPVKDYADAHGLAPLLDAQGAAVDRSLTEEGDVLASRGVAATLRWLNEPDRVNTGNAFYRTTLLVGAGKDQPGVDLLTAWYRRNFQICANLLQLAKPGDRIVVFYGSGHAFLLRQCVAETPGFALVEPNAYLPR